MQNYFLSTGDKNVYNIMFETIQVLTDFKKNKILITIWVSSSNLSDISPASSPIQCNTSFFVCKAVRPRNCLQHPILFDIRRGVTGSKSMPLAILYSQVLKQWF